MIKNPYEVLGLTKEATQSELTERYEQLRDKYKEDRFLPGEAGNEAANKLNELEEAWREIAKDIESRLYTDQYELIAKVIKEEKNYDRAQQLLDGIADRTAKWHFYQAQVYYYREWLVECRKQLTIALEMDPENEKYKAALARLDTVMGNSKADPKNVNAGDDIDSARASANRARQEEMATAGNTLSNCCTAYCLTSMCCDCMSCCCR